MFESRVVLTGQTFGSVVEITVRMPNRGGLYKGEALRVVEDLADQIAGQPKWNCRWESFALAKAATPAEPVP